MGERIRLFSTASFVSPATTSRCSEPSEGGGGGCGGGGVGGASGRAAMTVTTNGGGTTVIGLAKSHSLNSFEDSAQVFVSTTTTTRCHSGRKSHHLNHHQRNNSGVTTTTAEENNRSLEKKKSRIDAIGSLLSLRGHDEQMCDTEYSQIIFFSNTKPM
uniref:Uncharacterized protein n=1 Tax=Caenorhabditis tropicalis TaxID=1561998 RepID=A0A1I7TFN6_9PELO